ncbi:hypothetical protein BX600DRAFT_531446 [Xylariales sp. PMI_506]|nr:hypothetical protein BX600DRAFT_531446 [Xylariales sp. PMI_506]
MGNPKVQGTSHANHKDAGAKHNVRQSWAGPKDIGTSNPQQCLLACKREFSNALSEGNTQDVQPLCKKLLSIQDPSVFWSLYCCDMVYCGVWIEAGTVGQSHPGAPGSSCNLDDESPFLAVSSELSISAPESTGWVAPTHSASPFSPSALPPSEPTANPSSRMPATGLTKMQMTTTIEPDTPIPTESPMVLFDGTAEGAQIAIGLCVSMLAIGVALAVGYRFQRCWKRSDRTAKHSPPGGISSACWQAPNTPPTPFIAPLPPLPPPQSWSRDRMDTPSIPPPPRLSERKYLPIFPKSGPVSSTSSDSLQHELTGVTNPSGRDLTKSTGW